jgi:hypothetical protein
VEWQLLEQDFSGCSYDEEINPNDSFSTAKGK